MIFICIIQNNKKFTISQRFLRVKIYIVGERLFYNWNTWNSGAPSDPENNLKNSRYSIKKVFNVFSNKI